MSYNSNNVFAQIISGKLPAKVVYESQEILAFHDTNPASEKHILVIPKGQYESYTDFLERASSEEVHSFFKTASEIAKAQGMQKGFKIEINNGYLQHIPHFHIHLIA